MTTFQGLTATQWRNRINEYNPGMYSKEFLKNKTAKELAQIQNGKSYGVSESKSATGSKPMSAIRAKLEAIKKQKEGTCICHARFRNGILIATMRRRRAMRVRRNERVNHREDV